MQLLCGKPKSSVIVLDTAYVAETVVWPIPFLINMFTALKGSLF